MFKVDTLNDGEIFAFYEEGGEVTIYPNGDYVLTVNNCHCFERPTHSTILKVLKPSGNNVTTLVYYGKYTAKKTY